MPDALSRRSSLCTETYRTEHAKAADFTAFTTEVMTPAFYGTTYATKNSIDTQWSSTTYIVGPLTFPLAVAAADGSTTR